MVEGEGGGETLIGWCAVRVETLEEDGWRRWGGVCMVVCVR